MTSKERYEIGVMRIMAERQGLQRVEATAFEIDAPRAAVYADKDYRWRLAHKAVEFIDANCTGEVRLRFSQDAGKLILSFTDETDITVFQTGF